MRVRYWGVGLALLLTIVLAFALYPSGDDIQEQENLTREEEKVIHTSPNGTKYIVHPDDLSGGGPPKDGIPSIDDPKYVSVEDADEWIQDNELVLGMIYKGVKRVYPLQVLVWHEIVNDWIAGDPVLITYCPLCGSGIAFERILDGEPVEFGTSGKLYDSNLVMYERRTDTYWSQIDGLAIIGELTGTELAELSIDTVSWRDWKREHPGSEVLSRNTSYDKPYGVDPYGGYYEDSFIWFPVENSDDRIHPKTIVFGVEVNGTFKAYREEDVRSEGRIDDVLSGVRIRLEMDRAGAVKVTNLDTGEEIVKERGFWFAWYAFPPYTGLYPD
jgi:hypothetical protein